MMCEPSTTFLETLYRNVMFVAKYLIRLATAKKGLM